MEALKIRRVINLQDGIKGILARSTGQLTKWQLMKALTAQMSLGESSTININGIDCILNSIAREDGSGSSFHLIVIHNGIGYKCYCRTKD